MNSDLIILHGALGAAKQFQSLSNALSDDFNVYSFDFYGHGENDAQADFSIEWFTLQLSKVITEQNLKQPVVFGYSMGGYVALNLSLSTPESVGKIITLGTKFDWNPESSKKEAGYLNPDKILEKIPKYAEYLMTLHGDNWRTVLMKTADMMIELGENSPLHVETLKNCQVETVIGWGSNDKMVSMDESQRVAVTLPNGSFQILNDIEHPIDKIPTERLVEYIKSHS